jgi:hypothetical protein
MEPRGHDTAAFSFLSAHVGDEPEEPMGYPVLPNELPGCYDSPPEQSIVEVKSRPVVGCRMKIMMSVTIVRQGRRDRTERGLTDLDYRVDIYLRFSIIGQQLMEIIVDRQTLRRETRPALSKSKRPRYIDVGAFGVWFGGCKWFSSAVEEQVCLESCHTMPATSDPNWLPFA